MSDPRNLLLDREAHRGPAFDRPSPAWPTEPDNPDDAGQSPHRLALSRWPVEWRERWGHRANDLEDSGMNWRDAEIQAFIEVWNERRAGPKMDGTPFPMNRSPEEN
jgi:hypothetical protein